MILRSLILCAAMALTGCVVMVPPTGAAPPPKGGPVPQSTIPQGPIPQALPQIAPRADWPADAAAQAYARTLLESLQARSISERREYCGFLTVSPAGQIGATAPSPGSMAGCALPPIPARTFASWHTHGAFDLGFDNEVPSTTDLESDFAIGVDGYVSTPGGRFWHVDLDSRATSQICSRGCLTSDPGYQPIGEAGILQRFSLQDLYRRSSGF